MSDGFWGGMWVGLPAIVAALLAYKKSDDARKHSKICEIELRNETQKLKTKLNGGIMDYSLVEIRLGEIIEDISVLKRRIERLETWEDTSDGE